jgi:hypothetical protein
MLSEDQIVIEPGQLLKDASTLMHCLHKQRRTRLREMKKRLREMQHDLDEIKQLLKKQKKE